MGVWAAPGGRETLQKGLAAQPGYLKAVWLKTVGPVLRGFRPEIDPGTPLDRRGLPGTSICTKNQPRRLILRPFRGTQKLPPDCLQVPRSVFGIAAAQGAQGSWMVMTVPSAWLPGQDSQKPDWVPEGSLAKNFRAGFPEF